MPQIIAGPRGRPPFEIELAVFEEDTWMVLATGNFAREARQDADALIEEMAVFSPYAPGELVVKGNRAFAIVHDLDREPSCRAAWIDAALDALFSHCRTHRIHALAIEPLGCVHGDGDAGEFADRLRAHPAAAGLARIWIMT
jgi:hypothetical protein